MSWTGFIAGRYLFSKNNPNTINIISGISVAGFTVGAMALVVVLSVFNGFESLVQSLYNSFDPDIKITAVRGKTFNPDSIPLDKIREIEGVEDIAYSLEENVALRYDERQTIATLKGVSENFVHISGLDSMIYDGEYLLQSGDHNYALPGYGVAARLGISPHNDFVRLEIYVPKKGSEVTYNLERALNQVFVYPTGIFNIEDELNSKYVLVPLRLARNLLEEDNAVSAMEIALVPNARVDRIKESIQDLLGEAYEVKNREEQQQALYQVFKYEKWFTALILIFILFLLAVTAVSSLTMLVIDKRKDISILKSMGAENRQVWLIFLKEGLLISVIGAITGTILGLLLCWIQIEYGLVTIGGMGTFIVSAYPVKIIWTDILLVLLFTGFMGLFTGMLPAKKAASMPIGFHV